MKAEAAAVEFEEEEEKMAQMLDDGEVDPEALKAQEARLKEKLSDGKYYDYSELVRTLFFK